MVIKTTIRYQKKYTAKILALTSKVVSLKGYKIPLFML